LSILVDIAGVVEGQLEGEWIGVLADGEGVRLSYGGEGGWSGTGRGLLLDRGGWEDGLGFVEDLR
jgi:hypothetical protein